MGKASTLRVYLIWTSSTRHHEAFLAKQNRGQSHGKLSLLSAPGSVLIKTTLMKSPAGAAQTVFCQNNYRTIVAGRKIDAQQIEAYSLRWFSIPPGSLVPRPPPFFFLRFAFSIIHGSGRARKTGKAWEQVNDVRWTRGGHRWGRGSYSRAATNREWRLLNSVLLVISFVIVRALRKAS